LSKTFDHRSRNVHDLLPSAGPKESS
jgi:hypothetical protein